MGDLVALRLAGGDRAEDRAVLGHLAQALLLIERRLDAEEWDRIGLMCLAAVESAAPEDALAAVGAAVAAVAGREEAAWRAAMAAVWEGRGA